MKSLKLQVTGAHGEQAGRVRAAERRPAVPVLLPAEGQSVNLVVLQRGNIEQVGTPLTLYNTPANRFVAEFIGSPKMNIIEGEEAGKHGAHAIGIRPEHIAVSASEGAWRGVIGVAEHLGSDTFFHVHGTGIAGSITIRATGEIGLHHGDTVYMTPEAGKIHRVDEKGARL